MPAARFRRLSQLKLAPQIGRRSQIAGKNLHKGGVAMSGFRLSPVTRRRLALLGSTVFAATTALAVVACSGGGPPALAADSPIAIRTSQLSVVIENKVGMPLTDVDVAIVPMGGSTEFKKFVGRMESAEKRDLSLGAFYGRDGTTFNLRVVRPKAVRVTGKDLNAKAYSVEAPWQ
jgi:hypothetical protein